MTGYLVRRFLQMSLVVLLSTMAIYMLLNIAPGGPLAGLRMAAAGRQNTVSATDMERLRSYLGIDKPLLLRYFVWLIGDDWLGADWVYVGLGPYEIGETKYRFWADPGLAYLRPAYTIWVRGEWVSDDTFEATYLESKPSGEKPDDVEVFRVFGVRSPEIDVETLSGERAVVHTDSDTEIVMAASDAPPRPEDGTWVNISWLTGPYGMLGSWAGFHKNNMGVLRLDWGTSWKVAPGQPVSMLFKARLGNTLLLMVSATVLSLVVAIPIGIYSAVKQYSALDYAVTTFTFFGSSMPVFWFGLMMVLLFSNAFKNWGLPYLPANGVVMPRAAPSGSLLALLDATPGGLLDRAVHLIMPTAVLSLLYMAAWSRFMRASMLEVLRQDYVRTARAKGLMERVVIAKHALRNALIPIITIVVFQLPGFFGGAILTETIFAYIGIGRLYFQALGAYDWPVVMVFLFIQSMLVVIATLLGDILYTVVDPRIRYS